MGQWDGLVTSGDLELKLSIDYETPSGGQPAKWEGVGVVQKTLPLSQKEFETEIGTIFVTRRLFSNGGTAFEFFGSSPPKGILAVIMGIYS